MARVKKLLKLLVFICLVLLAGVGVGLSGGVPIPMIKNRRDSEKENIELLDSNSESTDSETKDIKG